MEPHWPGEARVATGSSPEAQPPASTRQEGGVGSCGEGFRGARRPRPPSGPVSAGRGSGSSRAPALSPRAAGGPRRAGTGRGALLRDGAAGSFPSRPVPSRPVAARPGWAPWGRGPACDLPARAPAAPPAPHGPAAPSEAGTRRGRAGTAAPRGRGAAMLGRRRVFAVEPLGGRDRAGEDLAHSCIVPGVTSTCRRILNTEDGDTPYLPEGAGEPRTLQGQVPPPILASWDSGVEMVAGDSSLAAFPELSQDSLNMEPMGSPEPQALAVPEPPSQLGQLLASQKLKQVLERSQGRAHLSTQHCALPAAPWSRPGCVLAAEAEKEGGPEEAEVVNV